MKPTKKSSASRSKAPPPPQVAQQRDWQYYAKIIGVAAAGLSGVIYIYNATVPTVALINASGPMPFAGRAEVETLRDQGVARFKTVDETIQQTLSVAQDAAKAAIDAKQQSNANRMARLLDQKNELQARIAAAPNDKLLKDVLEKVEHDIQDVLDEAKMNEATK